MSNYTEEKGYEISGPVPVGPVLVGPLPAGLLPVGQLPVDLLPAGPLQNKPVQNELDFKGSVLNRPALQPILQEPVLIGPAHNDTGPSAPVRGGPVSQKLGTGRCSPYPSLGSSKPVRPIKVRPEPICPPRAKSSTADLSKGDMAQILSVGSQLIAAARREAGQIVADAVEKAEAVAKRAEKLSLARSLATEADSMLRMAKIRDLFIRASAAELLELIETAVVAVVGELSAPPNSQTASSSLDANYDQSAELICARLLRSRITRAVREHLPASPAQIFIHPDDYERLIREECISMPAGTSPATVGRAAERFALEQNQFFVCDPSLHRGDARIRTDFGTVEISLPRQLEMVLGHISSSTALRDSLIAFLEAEDA